MNKNNHTESQYHPHRTTDDLWESLHIVYHFNLMLTSKLTPNKNMWLETHRCPFVTMLLWG